MKLKRCELLAMLQCVSTDETRYILCGVHVEVKPDKKPIMVATDGRALLVIESTSEPSSLTDRDFIIPTGVLTEILLAAKKHEADEIEFNHICESDFIARVGALTHSDYEQSFKFKAIEGNFPAWRQVIPPVITKNHGANQFCFRADYIMKFTKAATCLNINCTMPALLVADSLSAAVVRFTGLDNFVGVLMPCRGSDSLPEVPKFIQ